MAKKVFITGIDTDIGKTICTGILARYLLSIGEKVITYKPVQTGCEGLSEDIITHREIMGVGLQADYNHKTCGYIFKKPCSPHLAAELAGTSIDLDYLAGQIDDLSEEYDWVLVEGAGGLMVPLTREKLSLDFAIDLELPIILVTSTKLGSINHTLSSLEVLKMRGANLLAVFYNRYGEWDEKVSCDSRRVIARYLQKLFPKTKIIDFNNINEQYDFGEITKLI
ncbi:MAG: dethiobiotin synthase [Desulfotalea sp.]